MLSARYLANISDELVHEYNLLEYEIKKDMFKRIAQLEKVTDLDLYQAEILRQTSGLKLYIDKLISQYDSKTKKIVESLFSDAMNKAEENDLKFFKKAKRELSANQTQVAEATIGKLSDSMTINKNFAYRNSDLQTLENSIVKLTMTVADETEKQFLIQCNRAYMKLSSGAYSWQSAFQDSVESLAKDGVNCVLYTGSGKILKYSIESAMRMNVLTGINQTASKQTLENLEQLDTDLVEVSAHLGARNRDGKNEWSNHAKWQGKVFCREGERFFTDADGTRRFAPNFEESCGLGEADGICGINCRHSFYPYFEGTSLEYSKGELDEMKESTVTLDGKKISQYEAEESLRLCERNIRNYKSIAQGFEQTGMTDSPKYIQAKNKIYEWQNKARHITNETGLERKYINEWIGTKNGKQPTGWKPEVIVSGKKVPKVTETVFSLGKATTKSEAEKELLNFSKSVSKLNLVPNSAINGLNKMTQSLEDVAKKYNIKTLGEIKFSSATSYGAKANYRTLIVSKSTLTNPDSWNQTPTMYKQNIQKKIDSKVKILEVLKNRVDNTPKNDGMYSYYSFTYKNEKYKLEKEIAELKEKQLFSRHNVIYKGKEIECVIKHETGHIIADQKVGQINHSFANPLFSYNSNNELYNKTKMIDEVYKKAIQTGDIHLISSYGAENSHEFFAEAFCMYDMKVEKLPDYIVKMIEEVLK